jgi:two-component system, cell cycle sensor histidine kinase and response regulator CckA
VPGIAIVEDEYIVALDIKSFLERSGYRVAGMFSSGEELIRRFEELQPELILMDIKIRGDLDGVETARLIHERYFTPVVLLTAFADDETVARAKITQPFGYILKPFEERELRTAIEIALYRAAMEKRLRESEERYRNLFNEGISGNFLADGEGRIIDANPAFRSLVGIASDDVPLGRLEDFFADQAGWESFRDTLSSGRRFELAELVLRGADGQDLLVLANAAAILDQDGNMVGMRGELSDTTERRKLEERLNQAQKMEAVGRLAGGIAHDFNNILTAILGYSNLLDDEIDAEGPARDDVEGIRKAAARAANLTRQLLTFSRRQPFSPRPLDLNGLAKDTERLLRRLLAEDVALSLSLCDAQAVVVADPVQMEQVILNLALNARDAMPRGGSLVISLGTRRLESPLSVGIDTLAPGDYVTIAVVDSGLGIEPRFLDKIFEPFFTTKPKELGTGLGLSTAYGIAKQSGGTIGVVSEPGKGSAFTVWIPRATSPAEIEDEEEPALAGDLARPATILFVDDDEEVRALATKLLTKRGHRILAAANAGEALLMAESYGMPIDLMIADTVMPYMDGFSLARRIQSILPGIALLFISGHPGRASEPDAVGRFLAKPFTDAQLTAAVTKALGQR